MKRRWAAALALACGCAFAQDPPPGIVGKDGWLFYRYEAADASALPDTQASLRLIARLNRVLARNDVTLVVTLVPVKMRTHARHLPPSFPLTPYMAGQYRELARALRQEGVAFIDLDEPFRAIASRENETALFFRLDTHWSPSGALAAAEAIKAAIEADAKLRAIVDALPPRKYTMAREDGKVPSPANDLVAQLPAGSAKPEAETMLSMFFSAEPSSGAALLGDAPAPGITLLGSSYSADWTKFPDALRYALQRDILSISVPANQGAWAGMESYLRDDAFQTRPPKLLLWEIPERDMRAPPDHRFREARYRVDRTEWLVRTAVWLERACNPARAAVKATNPLANGIEIEFTRPLETLEYVSAQLVVHGATRVQVVATGPKAARDFEAPVPGDDAAHAFRLALPRAGPNGFDKVRITAANAHRFSVEALQTCRLPEDLLK